MFTLASNILQLFALSLDLPRDFFESYIQEHQSACRMLNYPHIDTPKDPDQVLIRASAHSDYGILTILKQDGVGGLQVESPITRRWVDIIPTPGAFIVNIGDLLMRWTNDYFKSTVHRVIFRGSQLVGNGIFAMGKCWEWEVGGSEVGNGKMLGMGSSLGLKSFSSNSI